MVEANTKQKQCVHFWVIDSPDGKISIGKCKHCGMVKEFPNNFEVVFINSENSLKNDDIQPEI